MTIHTRSPGETLAITAAEWNEMARAVNSLSGGRSGLSVPAGNGSFENVTLDIKAHRDLKIGEAVSLNKPLITVEEKKLPDAMMWLSKDASAEETVVVMTAPVKKDQSAEAVILGLALARASFANKATHVSPSGDKGALKGDTTGFPVLWQGADTGEQYALVLLGGGGAGMIIRECLITDSTSSLDTWRGTVYPLGGAGTTQETLNNQVIYFPVKWDAVGYPNRRTCVSAQVYDPDEGKTVSGWHVIDMSETIR